jgi:pimeloyl-ACP methyl ester carboxylesterase
MLDFLKQVQGIDLDRVVLAGHSAGGFGSLAALADDPAPDVTVRVVLDFAGGKGAPWLHEGSADGQELALEPRRGHEAGAVTRHGVRVPIP